MYRNHNSRGNSLLFIFFASAVGPPQHVEIDLLSHPGKRGSKDIETRAGAAALGLLLASWTSAQAPLAWLGPTQPFPTEAPLRRSAWSVL